MERYINNLIEQALAEDIGSGDITTEAIIAENDISPAVILAKQDLLLAGIATCREVFFYIDSAVQFMPFARDGERVSAGTELARLSGSTRALLMGERVALNFLQHLSGIATLTSKYVDKIAGTKARMLDTRKTIPGLRQLEKYAVRMGGGKNHRMGLYDMVLIKDNHIKAAGGITNAVTRVREKLQDRLKIEVETGSLDEVREALAVKVDILMLDNMSLDMMRDAVKIISGKAMVEASGNVTLETVRAIAETGVDFISSGSLTHSAPAADISMKIK
jgi:nicotinate-nucleotide pyrophosphorylase (carboxylating)